MKQTKVVVHILILLSLVAASLAFTTHPVQAAGAEILVTTPNDEDGGIKKANTTACSLREAIISANEAKAYGGCTTGTGGVDIIRIPASTRTYALDIMGTDDDARAGDLDILQPVEIVGAYGDLPRISAASAHDRVFHIRTNGTVLFRDISITGGDYVNKGGGIFIDRNFGAYAPTVTLSRVDLLGNHAAEAGGGLVVDIGTTAYVYFSEISNNTAGKAGGILNEGTLLVDSSLITQNKSTDTAGGSGGITANSQSDTEKTRIVNSTISDNDAASGSSGAGISVSSWSILELLNDTVVNNQGIGLEVKTLGQVTMKNTIIARQKKADIVKLNCTVESGAVLTSQGHNLTSDTSCGLSASGDTTVTVDELGVSGSLANNGGPTQTYALLETSPAVDAGDNSGCPGSDQRMRNRPAIGKLGGTLTCDIGSFELGGVSYMTYISLVRK